MAKAGIAIGVIIIVIIIIGAAYYASTAYKAPKTTISTTVAPAPTTVAASTTTAATTAPTAVLSTFSSKSATINASKATTVTVTAQDGVNITVMIPAGTYALINNQTVSIYNFTLATFGLKNVGNPVGYPNQTPAYGFAFEVNHQITPSISFVNSAKAPVPLTTIAHYPNTWGSWIFLGGVFNASTGVYTGGSYTVQNIWIYNTTSSTMTNTQFYKPVMWIFTIGPAHGAPPPSPITTAPASPSSTTVPATTTSGGYGGYP